MLGASFFQRKIASIFTLPQRVVNQCKAEKTSEAICVQQKFALALALKVVNQSEPAETKDVSCVQEMVWASSLKKSHGFVP